MSVVPSPISGWRARCRRLQHRLQHSGRLAMNLVLPPCCAWCQVGLDTDDFTPQLCRQCIQQYFSTRQVSCWGCGAIGGRVDSDRMRCAECQGQRGSISRVWLLGKYEAELRDAVVQMKTAAGEPLAAACGRRLGQLVAGQPAKPAESQVCADIVTCVPKYWLKRFATGANSAEVIMSSLALQVKIPAAADLLVCRRRIGKQSLLTPGQRKRNVRKAWQLNTDFDISGARVLLVDDVMTTGATAQEIARTLKRSGAKQVSLAIVARAAKMQ